MLVCTSAATAEARAATKQPPLPPPPHTNIVGGDQANPADFPFMAALIKRSASTRYEGFTCGATVLSPSWLLTAGHCVLDYDDVYPDSTYGNYVAPSYFAALTGIKDLTQSGGGQRLNVAAIYPYPSFDYYRTNHDYALLRLAAPTTAPAIRVIGTTSAERALDDPGTTQTIAGWGTTTPTGGAPTFTLRKAQVPVQSDATCTNAYPPGQLDPYGFPSEYHAASMICAGPIAGGKDTCSGDSGGPLAIQAADHSWRQVGVTSFGYGCAQAGHPGIYSRLTESAAWIGRERRFGPFASESSAYIIAMFQDFVHRRPTSAELGSWKAKLVDHPASDLPVSLQQSATWQNVGAPIARLYSAAFLRTPDTNGFTYWTSRRWSGLKLSAIASNYATSSEFVNRYGHLSVDGFIAQIYQNVFHRAADPSGKAYWHKKLTTGTTRGQMLYGLSDSSEYRRDTATRGQAITVRFALLRQAPTAAEVTANLPLALRTQVDNYRTSYRYAARFAG